jgi:hypothetical protein
MSHHLGTFVAHVVLSAFLRRLLWSAPFWLALGAAAVALISLTTLRLSLRRHRRARGWEGY